MDHSVDVRSPSPGSRESQGTRRSEPLGARGPRRRRCSKGYLIGGIGAQTPGDGVDMVVDRLREVNLYRCAGLVLIEFNSVAVAIIAATPARLRAICIASPSEISSSAMRLAYAKRTPRQ